MWEGAQKRLKVLSQAPLSSQAHLLATHLVGLRPLAGHEEALGGGQGEGEVLVDRGSLRLGDPGQAAELGHKDGTASPSPPSRPLPARFPRDRPMGQRKQLRRGPAALAEALGHLLGSGMDTDPRRDVRGHGGREASGARLLWGAHLTWPSGRARRWWRGHRRTHHSPQRRVSSATTPPQGLSVGGTESLEYRHPVATLT